MMSEGEETMILFFFFFFLQSQTNKHTHTHINGAWQRHRPSCPPPCGREVLDVDSWRRFPALSKSGRFPTGRWFIGVQVAAAPSSLLLGGKHQAELEAEKTEGKKTRRGEKKPRKGGGQAPW